MDNTADNENVDMVKLPSKNAEKSQSACTPAMMVYGITVPMVSLVIVLIVLYANGEMTDPVSTQPSFFNGGWGGRPIV